MPDLMTIDFEAGTVTDKTGTHAFATAEGYAAVSRAWIRASWDAKYIYSFTWLGRPIIQLPEDMVRLQEIIYAVQPDVIVETGVAHGGSLVFSAGLLKLMGKSRVIGIDIEIRKHNRTAIEAHPLSPMIHIVEASSTLPETVKQVKGMIKPGERVMVLLDSNHTKEHVLAELDAYADLVAPGSYIVAMDGILGIVVGAPRTKPEHAWNHPATAAIEFAARRPDFEIVEPEWLFNEGAVKERTTYWPSAFLKRKG